MNDTRQFENWKVLNTQYKGKKVSVVYPKNIGKIGVASSDQGIRVNGFPMRENMRNKDNWAIGQMAYEGLDIPIAIDVVAFGDNWTLLPKERTIVIHGKKGSPGKFPTQMVRDLYSEILLSIQTIVGKKKGKK